MVIKALFFDFDGTISDSKKIALESFIETLEEFGYKKQKREIQKLVGEKMQIMLKHLRIKKEYTKIRKRFYDKFEMAAKQGGIKLCVPIEPLKKLKEKNIPLIIVSNSETNFLNVSIKRLKLKKLFSKTYGADRFKTKDEMLKKLFKKMKIKPYEAMYIGDRFSDIKFAKDAGFYSVAIHNKCSWSSLETIKKEKPNFIVKDFTELKKIVFKLNKIKGKIT
jgi:phosphoglycolate phosphatase-like HAD superfamily hydrolase